LKLSENSVWELTAAFFYILQKSAAQIEKNNLGTVRGICVHENSQVI
jgi:hypothetical protein